MEHHPKTAWARATAMSALMLLPALALAEGPPVKAAAAPAPAPVPPSSEVAKAVDGLGSSCAKVVELRGRMQTLADQRKASRLAISAAQSEARKQLGTVKVTQLQIQRELKKPGGDATALLDKARTAHAAAVTQTTTIAHEQQALSTAEEQASTLAAAVDEAWTACAASEAALREAANAARRVLAETRRESVKARVFAALQPAKVLEAQRARQTRELEALQKSSDEAKGALAALGAVAPAAAANAATPTQAGTTTGKPAHPQKQAAADATKGPPAGPPGRENKGAK